MKEDQLLSLLNIFGQVYILEEGMDRKFWMASMNGILLLVFFCSVLKRRSTAIIFCIWKMNAPPRVIASAWISPLGGVLVMDNSRKQQKIHYEFMPHVPCRCRVGRSFILKF
eukprot:TRINITY_DN8573_c0_g1_i1.p1 TRINITY_DN8573_c0_g1~~TRINITY_DN8573_c0_g1_i1.p1  ORF type:complete len:112 (-),score=9.89 TRINITY_DN8573_c0_g1_i1:1282-1617(-)